MPLKFRRTKRRTLITAFVLAGLTACVPAYVSAYTVSGPSEAPTLLLGDRVIVNHAAYDWKLPYSSITLAKVGSPRRGDLVLFRIPNREGLGLKVVAGIPGDEVAMVENQLYLNQTVVPLEPLDRKAFDWVPEVHGIGSKVARETLGPSGFTHEISYTPELSPLRSFASVKVPEGCCFLLGDHRDNSNDSRVFGVIAGDAIEGKVVYGRR